MLRERESSDAAQCHPGVTAPACQLPEHHGRSPSPARALQVPQPLVTPTWTRYPAQAPQALAHRGRSGKEGGTA